MPSLPDPKLRHWWTRIVCGYRADRETLAAYCKRNDVRVASFYQWRKKITQADRAACEQQSHELSAPTAFVSVDVEPDSREEVRAVIELPSGVRIGVPVSEPELVLEVVRTLAQHSCDSATVKAEVAQ